MHPQIKQRIEQIRRGEVPEGYKRTKAGIVPMEWEEVRIGDVLTQRKILQCVSKDAPLLSFTIEEGVIDPADKKSNKRDFLIKDITTKKFALTEVGDIIYNPANLKFGAIHRNNLRRGVVSPIYGIFYGAQNSTFMGHLLHNQRFIDYAKIYAEGTVEKLKTLSADTFKKLKITLPSLKEQDKIAEILAAQDKLIALKEKLIEEKKRQKKALMQQLLTGKKRLPGFSGEWKQVKLGDICNTFSGGTPNRSHSEYYGGDIPWIKSGELNHGDIYDTEETLTDLGLNNSSAKIAPKGTLLIAMYGATAGILAFTHIDAAINQAILALIPTTKASTCFIKESLDVQIETATHRLTQGGQPNFNASIIESFSISMPCFEEQEAISNIAKTADHEIALLNNDLYQEKQKKKALMQLLLTGIVRV